MNKEESDMAEHLRQISDELRTLARQAKKINRRDVWNYIDDASDFAEHGALMLSKAPELNPE